jgi:hypothetical protein
MTTDTRIESLETQVRTLKRMLFGVFGLVVVGGLLAATSLQSVPDVVKAKSFEVVNDEGKAQVILGADAEGGMLGIYNKDEKREAGIFVSSFGGRMGIYNKNGDAVAGLSAIAGGGILTVTNKDLEVVAGLSADADGRGVIVTFDSTGQVTSQSP